MKSLWVLRYAPLLLTVGSLLLIRSLSSRPPRTPPCASALSFASLPPGARVHLYDPLGNPVGEVTAGPRGTATWAGAAGRCALKAVVLR